MCQCAIGNVFHAQCNLAAHCDALSCAQWRQSTVVTCLCQLAVTVAARRTQKRLQITLQPPHT